MVDVFLKVLLGRSDVAGWGAFLKVVLWFLFATSLRTAELFLSVLALSANVSNVNTFVKSNRTLFQGMITLESIQESLSHIEKQISVERFMIGKTHLSYSI